MIMLSKFAAILIDKQTYQVNTPLKNGYYYQFYSYARDSISHSVSPSVRPSDPWSIRFETFQASFASFCKFFRFCKFLGVFESF